ncbi:arginine--tRNA ligase, chloroplastic/mitochondrial [Tanacetum coccineum]
MLLLDPSAAYSLDEMLDVKGNTFVYLLNTLALVHSIMKNSRREMFKLKKELVAKERDLALHLVRFTDVVEDSCTRVLPHLMCEYLCDLYHSGILKRPTVTREIPILTRGGLFLLPGLKIQDGWSELSGNDVGFDCMLHNSATAVSKEEKKLKKFWEEDRQVKCEYMSFRSKAGVLRIYYILLRDAIDVTMELRYVSPLPDLEGFKVRGHVFAYYDGVLNEVDDTKKMCYKAIVF